MLRHLYTLGNFVRIPDGRVGMVRAFNRRYNMVSVQLAATGMVEALHNRPYDLINRLREAGHIKDYHFINLRVAEGP